MPWKIKGNIMQKLKVSFTCDLKDFSELAICISAADGVLTEVLPIDSEGAEENKSAQSRGSSYLKVPRRDLFKLAKTDKFKHGGISFVYKTLSEELGDSPLTYIKWFEHIKRLMPHLTNQQVSSLRANLKSRGGLVAVVDHKGENQ